MKNGTGLTEKDSIGSTCCCRINGPFLTKELKNGTAGLSQLKRCFWFPQDWLWQQFDYRAGFAGSEKVERMNSTVLNLVSDMITDINGVAVLTVAMFNLYKTWRNCLFKAN